MKIKKVIKNVKNDIVILFVKKKNLIYKFENSSTNFKKKHVYVSRRLCLFDAILKNVFKIVHEDFHLKFHKCYEHFFMYCIRSLIVKFKTYLRHYSQCQMNQIKRHKTYNFLKSIDSSNVFFYTIIIDFIMTLSKSFQKLNSSFFAICKFFKKITFVSKKMI